MEDAGLSLIVTDKNDDAQMAAGLILSQSLQPGSIAEKGSVVTAVTSRGPSRVLIPDVRFMRAEDARTMLEEAGLKVNLRDVQDADHPAGTIIAGIRCRILPPLRRMRSPERLCGRRKRRHARYAARAGGHHAGRRHAACQRSRAHRGNCAG
ncbi:MAG: PASTA domain-containing protein [Merdibacter sp.]